MEDTYCSTTVAAKAAGVSVQSIHNWIKSGRIKERIEMQGGKKIHRVDVRSLRDYLATIWPANESAADE